MVEEGVELHYDRMRVWEQVKDHEMEEVEEQLHADVTNELKEAVVGQNLQNLLVVEVEVVLYHDLVVVVELHYDRIGVWEEVQDHEIEEVEEQLHADVTNELKEVVVGQNLLLVVEVEVVLYHDLVVVVVVENLKCQRKK